MLIGQTADSLALGSIQKLWHYQVAVVGEFIVGAGCPVPARPPVIAHRNADDVQSSLDLAHDPTQTCHNNRIPQNRSVAHKSNSIRIKCVVILIK